MSIYTRTGDDGTTVLFGGKRVKKNHILLECIGVLDELNSAIGVVLSYPASTWKRHEFEEIQSDIFTVSSILSGRVYSTDQIKKRTAALEKQIDAMESLTAPLSSFIHPGGSPAGSFSHFVRSVSRRAERTIVSFTETANKDSKISRGDVSDIMRYLNRLSDYFYMLARFINLKDKKKEIPWKGLSKRK